VVVATSTSSGKSLCYNIPVVETLYKNSLACALYVFPTKVFFCSFILFVEPFINFRLCGMISMEFLKVGLRHLVISVGIISRSAENFVKVERVSESS
jgi:hypothetical protein